jgi:hypothetical protein
VGDEKIMKLLQFSHTTLPIYTLASPCQEEEIRHL